MKRLICISVLLALALVPAFGDTKAGMEKKLTKVQNEIAELDKQIKANEAKSSDAAAQLTLTRKKIAAGKELAAELSREIDATNKEIGAKKKDISKASERYRMMLDAYELLIRQAYVNRDTKMWLTYILSGKDVGQMLRRYNYLHSVSEDMRAQAKDIRGQKEYLEREMAALDSLRAEEEALLQARSDELQSLKKDEKNEKAMVDKLKRNKSSYEKQIAKKQKEVEALNKAIRDIVAKEAAAQKKAKKGTTGKSSPKTQADIKLSNEFAANKGKLPWPVKGTVVWQYGQHNHPVYTNVKMPFNNGCNIATATNEPVKAVFGGTVKNVAMMPGYNQCVLVQHGDYYTFYCKLHDVRVNTGDKVNVGDILGSVDTISGETQLHFQLWHITDPQDPELWLQ
ncbi:MAG: peptidoglycan DD-metalloendopeptidase family protein [Bacteroidales bacterium]|nr:peptidoglycan DD-metalloendopeptidase family protein [Bacteroidales bacterium]